MRSDFSFLAMFGLANAGLVTRQSDVTNFRPLTNNPDFFSLRVDTSPLCLPGVGPVADQDGNQIIPDCTFVNYAIRLTGGSAIATPFTSSTGGRLPILFVDDDTKMYTVSEVPLQFYIDLNTGALQYGRLGSLPANAVTISFYKSGDNPLGITSPSPSFLSWPSTQGLTSFALGDGPWWLCPIGPGRIRQFKVYINNQNFGAGNEDLSSDVSKDPNQCRRVSLAAINADPFQATGLASAFTDGTLFG